MDEGYRVLVDPDGQEALAACATLVIDLVLCDLMLPRLDGVGLVTQLRADPRTAALPVLMMSAAPERNTLSYTAYDRMLRKPFPLHELLTAVERALAGVRAIATPITPPADDADRPRVTAA